MAAARMVERIQESVELLAQHPEIGRPGRVSGTRELIVRNSPFIVPYRIHQETIEVITVFHAARQWPDRF